MKILWFTNTPGLYIKTPGFQGGGWIASLQENLIKQSEIKLGISFYYPDKTFKRSKHNCIYYPISLYKTKFKKIHRFFFHSKLENKELNYYKKVIDDFKPDIIQVFGTENNFGLVQKLTKTPVIIHLQGLTNPIFNSYFGPGVSKNYIFKTFNYNPFKIALFNKGLTLFKNSTANETRIFKLCKYFIGRTHWDKSIVGFLSKNSQYFHVDEVLRGPFYENYVLPEKKGLTITSTLSKSYYKGFDLVLKTAMLLKKNNINFEWKVFGIDEYNFWEKKLKIKAKDVNVFYMGTVGAKKLISNLTKSTIFIHPSYIDNSPNSVCEAQILGLPVIATNVGGVSSLIQNNKTGVLVPANDPYYLASKIVELQHSKEKMNYLSINAQKEALSRHSKEKIVNSLVNVFNLIINENNTAKGI